jgi:PAS domain S-box-containing protein
MKPGRRWIEKGRVLVLAAVATIGAVAAMAYPIRQGDQEVAALVWLGLLAGIGLLLLSDRRRRRVLRDLRGLTRLSQEPDSPIDPAFFETREVAALAMLWPAAPVVPPTPPDATGERPVLLPQGLGEGTNDATHPTSRFIGTSIGSDMVGRLEPGTLRWRGATPALAQFLGWSIVELSARTLPDSVHPDDRELAREQLLAAQAKGEAHGLIYRVVTSGGQTRVLELHVGVRFGDDQRPDYLRCRAFDVTARVRASRELRRRTRDLTRANVLLREANRELAEMTARYGDLYENAPAMYFKLDIDGAFELCNKTLLQTLGYSADDLIGKPYETLVAPERLPLVSALRQEFHRQGHIEVDGRWVAADGRTLDVHVTLAAVRDETGAIVGARGVGRDVTAFKALDAALRERNAHLARVVDELKRKNHELDEFGHGVSHDLQEPLRTLISFSRFLLEDCGDRLDEKGREYVGHIVNASYRMRALIGDLLELSRAGKVAGEFGPVDPLRLIETVRIDLSELVRTRDGTVLVHEPLPMLWGDGPRLGQLLANLIGNGLKYRGEGSPVVEVGAQTEKGGWTVLEVRDNGIGIDPRFHEKIFQLFRRLYPREQDEGNGAGLAICRKIAQAHGGDIWVESEPGRGSSFFVRLPVADDRMDLVEAREAVHV